MNDLGKYPGHMIEQRPANFEAPPESGSHSTSNLIRGVLRRWYIVLLIFFVMCTVGIPAIWLSIEPLYNVTGAIRVAPFRDPIIPDELDRAKLSTYQTFMYTQAEMITSSRVVQRVATDLADKNLTFFESEPTGLVTKLKQTLKNTKAKPEPASILKQAIYNGIISAAPGSRTELIKVTIRSTNKEDAVQIVNAFINVYKDVEGASSIEDEGRKLTVLENEQNVRAEKLKSLRGEIKGLATGNITITSSA